MPMGGEIMRSLSSIAAFWLLSSATAIADDVSVQRGGSLANKICSACHVVGADQEFSPILRDYGPDFREIAGRKDVSAGSPLKTFLRTTHVRASDTPYKMPNLLLTEQMDAVVDYILGLKAN
jgi:mono/diheme cytochrome c family protein